MSYARNLLSMTTRWLNALLGGNRRGESVSSAVGRKAAAGRRGYIIAEAAIDFIFALIGQRHHCARFVESTFGNRLNSAAIDLLDASLSAKD